MKISFMNELARFCEKVGADIEAVRRGISTDTRIGTAFLFAGAGYGGSCFPKDVQAILRTAAEYDQELKLIAATEQVNEEQKKILFSKINAHYNGDVKGKVFAVWGLSFKPRTDDMREAPAIVLINALLEAGATVKAYDPEAMETARWVFGDRIGQDIELVKDPYEASEGADALALVTEWHDFRTPDFGRIAGQLGDKVVFDGRNIWKAETVQEAGLAYYAIGKKVEGGSKA
jgi:UDPglucose 6-dehydrogenase